MPSQCIQPKEQRLEKSQIDNQESIPTIDLSNFCDLNVEKSIREAATKWGCFQIINHGIPNEVLEDLKDAAHRYQVLEYQKWAKPLAKKLLEVLLKGLNVNEIDESLEPLLMGTMNINMNYYPPCPNPSITMGARRHCDGSCITLLFKDDMEGLYILGTKGDNWIHVNSIKGALAVNIGDLLQIISNDQYKSIEHCVAVESSRA
ncbi:hypothetical protein RDI58_014689 [Solanum bulbocastanum]|uniref:Fe2OG dioxygenase domain-containing protein n=1 Tax=Solanum bulbocastanum TaxID=147425 RepID=A0AAN8TDX2_SOLBU